MFVWTVRLGRWQIAQLVRDIPFVLVVNHCAAAGQVAGLLNPLEKGAREFSHFEMNEPRLLRVESAPMNDSPSHSAGASIVIPSYESQATARATV